jgi:hypothetical protein
MVGDRNLYLAKYIEISKYSSSKNVRNKQH